jgi:hypothetical protein
LAGNLLKICPFVRSKEKEIIIIIIIFIKGTSGVEFGTEVCIHLLYFTGYM